MAAGSETPPPFPGGSSVFGLQDSAPTTAESSPHIVPNEDESNTLAPLVVGQLNTSSPAIISRHPPQSDLPCPGPFPIPSTPIQGATPSETGRVVESTTPAVSPAARKAAPKRKRGPSAGRGGASAEKGSRTVTGGEEAEEEVVGGSPSEDPPAKPKRSRKAKATKTDDAVETSETHDNGVPRTTTGHLLAAPSGQQLTPAFYVMQLHLKTVAEQMDRMVRLQQEANRWAMARDRGLPLPDMPLTVANLDVTPLPSVRDLEEVYLKAMTVRRPTHAPEVAPSTPSTPVDQREPPTSISGPSTPPPSVSPSVFTPATTLALATTSSSAGTPNASDSDVDQTLAEIRSLSGTNMSRESTKSSSKNNAPKNPSPLRKEIELPMPSSRPINVGWNTPLRGVRGGASPSEASSSAIASARSKGSDPAYAGSFISYPSRPPYNPVATPFGLGYPGGFPPMPSNTPFQQLPHQQVLGPYPYQHQSFQAGGPSQYFHHAQPQQTYPYTPHGYPPYFQHQAPTPDNPPGDGPGPASADAESPVQPQSE
ncbi:hypothetical protein CI109_103547 [Kwoniella shandongensis]|uniref:Uncharacterized protein n=1 Tax=Kwoniella shandongensis TaxID=1734106 RepID=A0A5M6BVX6_9TREE|nr:uncharacterized protein CI109_004551 [Kwoniella shandongensis]KAA5527016.1 hypothetical protein CI109_004551 [Kwoniella shandongensis]